MCIHPGASPTFGGWRTMEAETRHLPEYRCLAPSLQPVTEPPWLRSPRCGFEQRFLYGNGPAQVGLGSFEPHHLYIKTERSVPATHANVQHRTSNECILPVVSFCVERSVKKRLSDTRRKRLRCASDIHHSSIVNRQSSFHEVSYED